MASTGILHQGMYNILQEWYQYISTSVHIQADLIGIEFAITFLTIVIITSILLLYIVYLRSSPEVVYERMKERARSEESFVPLEYLKQLHDLHENWLIHGLFERPAPVSNY